VFLYLSVFVPVTFRFVGAFITRFVTLGSGVGGFRFGGFVILGSVVGFGCFGRFGRFGGFGRVAIPSIFGGKRRRQSKFSV